MLERARSNESKHYCRNTYVQGSRDFKGVYEMDLVTLAQLILLTLRDLNFKPRKHEPEDLAYTIAAYSEYKSPS
ncbi:hypothetical protein KN1_13800 [Stygiolobus caldivivus]|uniref:Uncharacterized protein n=1 Tax=Stygiolobus caldivivus TaxID=2824673 RepID=A0A8D5U693_9CREN|nr:hypothetical protein KN1_13800 [Stygiolobus caldivivus]